MLPEFVSERWEINAACNNYSLSTTDKFTGGGNRALFEVDPFGSMGTLCQMLFLEVIQDLSDT